MSHDPKTIIERFRTINKQRLERAYAIMRPSQRDFLRLIPFFFQVNHPMLPGYTSRDTPAGIKTYEPEKDTLHDVYKYSRSINYRRPPKCAINAIYSMGSIGTISHSNESDFDFWLCHDSELTEAEIKKLEKKAQAIEQAADKLHIEVHFFLVNAETFRSGEQLELSSESSGTAQHHLLLDEFYRTAVLLEGQFPAWWIVPPEEDHRYDEYMQEVERKRFFFFREIIDFGEVNAIPPEEFFGAAVWQLAKAIDSPYKSLIKLLLIECYMSEHPNMHLLSQQFKQAVYEGETDLDRLDPYRLLVERLESYLIGRDDQVRLELLYRSFYFKINLPLSNLPPKTFEWQRVMLTEMTQRWNWQKLDLILLDDRSNWQVPQVVNERQILFDALAGSYRALSHFAHEIGAESMISAEDLTILGRKLFAAYERKAGKIELIRRGIEIDLLEHRLSVHELRDEEGRSIWYLFTGYVEKIVKRQAPIKQTRSLVELLAWAYFNEIINRNSSIALFSKNPVIDDVVVKRIVDRLFFEFPLGEKLKSGVDSFSQPSRLEHSQYLVNTGIQLADGFDRNKYETEGRGSEPLSYGFNKECLLKRLDWIQSTSWGEVLCNRYFGEKGLAEAIIGYFKWYSSAAQKNDEMPDFMSTGITKGTSITHRLGELFSDLGEWFYDDANASASRYLLALGKQLYLFEREGELLRYKEFKKLQDLMVRFSKPNPQFVSTMIDRHTMQDSPIPTIYEKNKNGIIQLFFRVLRKTVEIYVLDERGTLFRQVSDFYDQTILINQFSHFFESIINRINFLTSEGGETAGPQGLEFYAIKKDPYGRFSSTRQSPDFFKQGRKFFSLQVIVDSDEDNKTTFTVYCEESEFSSLEHGNKLFEEVVKHILSKRPSGEHYPIYITDISMATDLLVKDGVEKVQAVQFLQYKERIEGHLNQVLQRLS
ncbi:MAG: class I adenylate cyclase [Gammaproteobacteria bacterium]|nr:class I adenylate cyclase [Gammaproteobacteria bacterium]